MSGGMRPLRTPGGARSGGGEPQRAPARGSLSRVLALQRAAGNRAVGAILARETDTRLEHSTPEARAEVAAVRGRRLPFWDPRNPMRGWDTWQILSNFTQVDRAAATRTDQVRCAANSVVAIAVSAGPNAVYQLCLQLSDVGGRRAWTQIPEQAQASLEGILRALDAAGRIQAGTAGYEDLDAVADAVKAAMTRRWRGFSWTTEVAGMARLVGSTESRAGTRVRDRREMDRLLDAMEPGDAYVMNIDTDVLAPGTAPDPSQANHFICVMRDPNDRRGRGRWLLYDPWPRTGSQLIPSGSVDFWEYFTTTDGRFKYVELASRTRMPTPRWRPER